MNLTALMMAEVSTLKRRFTTTRIYGAIFQQAAVRT
jgi:hypothetical protein